MLRSFLKNHFLFIHHCKFWPQRHNSRFRKNTALLSIKLKLIPVNIAINFGQHYRLF
jgi:hypothetical protein